MDKYNKLIKEYGIYHTKLITKITHIIGIPLIVLAIFIFISWLTINVDQNFRVHLVYLFTIILSIYYIKIHLKFGLILTILFILFNIVIYLFHLNEYNKQNLSIFLYMFIIGWIFQFIGHFFEKNKPAFFDNIMQIFAAPLFVVCEIYYSIGNCFGKKIK